MTNFSSLGKWRRSAGAVAFAIGVAVGPVAQPAGAQSASPTPTAVPHTVSLQIAPAVLATPTPAPQRVAVSITNTQSLVTGPIPTQPSIGSQLARPTAVALQLGGCADQLFTCTIDRSNGTSAEDVLQQWAINSALQLYKLPATDGPLLMSNARGSLRALVLARLLTASQKSPSNQTPEEAALLATLRDQVKQFKINVARDAQAQYEAWQVNPFCYEPPPAALAAGGWSCDPTPTPQEQLFQPEPPTYDQFTAWGTAIEMTKLGQADDATVGDIGVRMKALEGMAGAYVPTTVLSAVGGYSMPQSWYRTSAPFRFRQFLNSARQAKAGGGEDAGAETGGNDAAQTVTTETGQAGTDASTAASAEAGSGEAVTDSAAATVDTGIATAEVAETGASTASTIAVAGASGALLVGSSVGIILICVAALVQGSIDLATRVQLPDKLDGAITDAQNSTPDLAGADNALAQQIFAEMTAQEPASVDPGPPPSASDLTINVDDPTSQQSIHYLAPDGTYHTARAPQNGWWVDTDANGTSQLTLGIDFLDPYQTSWYATRAGSSILLSRDVDANPADEVATTTFEYLDWNPSDHTKFVTRHARFTAPSTETWSITASPSNIGGDSIAHFNSATGQWSSVDGGAIKVAVGPSGQPWVLNKQGTIFNRSRGQTGYVDGAWQTVPGSATDIAVGADGSVWAIGAQHANIGGNTILHYNPSGSSDWDLVDGGAIAVAVGPDGQPWVVNAQGQIFNRTRGENGYVDGTWQVLPGQATDIAVGSDGSVWVVGTNPANGGHPVYHYNPFAALAALANVVVGFGVPLATTTPSVWDQVDGAGVAIAVDANGEPWLINSNRQVYRRSLGKNGYTDGTWNTVSPAGTATSIGAGGPLY